MKRILAIVLTFATALGGFCFNASAGGYIDSNITIDGDIADYEGEKIFDKAYCYGHNDFESVSNYTGNGSYYLIKDSGSPLYKKSLEVPAFNKYTATADPSAEGVKNATYTFNEKVYPVFNESLVIDDNYILSYDYKSDIAAVSPTYAFTLGPQFSVFDKGEDKGVDYAKYYSDGKWHSKQIGFKAEQASLNLKINARDYNVRSFIDNILIMKAATLILKDSTSSTRISDLAGNILSGDSNYSESPLIPMGSTAKFKVNAKKGLLVTVKMGEKPIAPDKDGIYYIPKVTDNITVTADMSEKIITENFFADENDNVYLPMGSTVYALSLRTGFDNNVFGIYRENIKLSDDAVIFVGDKLKVFDGEKSIKEFSVKLAGDTDNNGIINVTDVVNAMDSILTGDTNIMTIDQNGDGKLTASDIVALRNVILAGGTN